MRHSQFPRSVTLLCVSVFCIGPCLDGDTCNAHAQQTFASLELLLQAEARLVAEPFDDRDTGLVTISDAFAFVPPSPFAHVQLTPAKRTGINEWLKNLAQAQHTRKVTFSIKGKRVVPQNLIINTRDPVDACLDGKNTIFIHMSSNPPPGTTYCGMSYTFRKPEAYPVRVCGPKWMDLEPAHLLITDHQVAGLTNDQGVVRFEALPVGFDIPIRVFSSKIKEGIKTKLVFPTLEASVKGHPVFYAKEPGQYRHVIQIVEDTDSD